MGLQSTLWEYRELSTHLVKKIEHIAENCFCNNGSMMTEQPIVVWGMTKQWRSVGQHPERGRRRIIFPIALQEPPTLIIPEHIFGYGIKT